MREDERTLNPDVNVNNFVTWFESRLRLLEFAPQERDSEKPDKEDNLSSDKMTPKVRIASEVLMELTRLNYLGGDVAYIVTEIIMPKLDKQEQQCPLSRESVKFIRRQVEGWQSRAEEARRKKREESNT